MSFLESIKHKQKQLKKTETVVTQIDGKVFVETKSGNVCIGNKTGFVIDNKPDTVPAKIVNFLFLGSQDCCDESVIETYDFKFILSLGVEAPSKQQGITYKFVECLDLPETNLLSVINECVPFIKTALSQRLNILVHCNAGVSRSASVIIGYLMLVENFSYVEAYDYVKKARSCINPNTGFIKQLQTFE